MTSCREVHERFDRHANGTIQSGTLPAGFHVQGRVAWYAYQGPYSGISKAFPEFIAKVQVEFPGSMRGPPGDVYACSPMEHGGPLERTMTTIFWVPIA